MSACNYYIGVDVGTSSVKVMLISDADIVAVASRDYPLSFPHPGWSEQNPEDWYRETVSAVREVVVGVDASLVRSVSFSGQMHGLVMLDADDNVIRPAILWNDGRSSDEVAYLNDTVGKGFLLNNTGNIAFAGFTAPKLLWVKRNEPENFAKAAKIMLPKDYVAYRLSGVFATDVSDAAGTLYFDTARRDWSDKMLALLGIGRRHLPEVRESCEAIGCLRKEVADELGLPETVKVVIGAGDNAASAIGNGAVEDGSCNISLGTSGTVFVCSDKFACDRVNAIHSFCSANGKYHYLACTLTAASSQKWWIEDILKTGYDYSVGSLFGKTDVLFLPYLMGERSPVNDTAARGIFAGLSMNTSREEMSLAVLEGVAFSLKQNLEIIRDLGVDVRSAGVCGGGAKNEEWLRLLATVLDVELAVPRFEHGGVLGACILAAQGVGADVSGAFWGTAKTVSPIRELTGYYAEKYQRYLRLYPAAKALA